MARPTTLETDVILPPEDMASIKRHAIGLGDRRRSVSGRWPSPQEGLVVVRTPGTGKTHTINYLMAAMSERTVVVLQGPSVGALGYAAAIVRSFPPSMLVIEDIDLIAYERAWKAWAQPTRCFSSC